MADQSERKTFYLETSVLIDLIGHAETVEPAKTLVSILEDAKKGRYDVVTSAITIVEVLKAKHEVDSSVARFDQAVHDRIQKLWHPGTSPIRIVEVHELIAREALRMFRDGLMTGLAKTKGNDLVHLATAKREGVDEFFVSGNKDLRKWEPAVGFKICAPHWEPKNPDPMDMMLGSSKDQAPAAP